MIRTDSSPQPIRLQRSQLAVPASSPHFFEKAARGDADSIFLDLEDAVRPEIKDRARDFAVQALNDVDWGNKVMSVRVNGLDTPWGWEDIVVVARRCPRLDAIMLPKTNRPADVHFVDTLLSGIEMASGRKLRIGIEALIETAPGLAHVEQIAASSSRLESLIFGIGDFSLSIQTGDLHSQGGPSALYQVLASADASGQRPSFWGDPWHHALGRIVTAARAYGLRPIDGPFGSVADEAGYRASARRGAMLGFEGKWCIHPSQVAPANEVHSPAPEVLAWAQRVAAQLEAADGAGAVLVDGSLVDLAHVRMAEHLMTRQKLIDDVAARKQAI